MNKVLLYSSLLIVGIIASLTFNLDPLRHAMELVTLTCVGYIMIEVGLEFVIDKNNLRSYGKDYLIAATAAGFPWLFCSSYFYFFFPLDFEQALLIGRFAAPTSAGILFAMLAAAGLGTTWLFKKARILAIFDDLDTILFLIPLQILIVGLKWQLFVSLPIIVALLLLAYFFLHRLRLPVTTPWLLLYAVLLLFTANWVEVLLPAFVLGCILHNPHTEQVSARLEPKKVAHRRLDVMIKGLFMLLVGATLPPIEFEGNGWLTIALHVAILFVLSNVGKMFPTLCYKREAPLKTRLALSIALFPRGEVGASVLLVTIGYGIQSQAIPIAALSLALNLLLTGLFIWVVVKLTRERYAA